VAAVTKLQWLRSSVARSLTAAVEMLFPPACAICGDLCDEQNATSRANLICDACVRSIWHRDGLFCRRCAMPVPDLPNAQETCAHCRAHKPAFAGARTLGVYDGPLRDAVLRSKHHGYESLAMQLGRLLAQRIDQERFDPWPEAIAPVPMYWLKRVWRKANPAETLAHSVARELRLPCIADLVRCRRWLAKQHLLPRTERQKNVQGAFSLGWGFDIRGATLLVVDDVVTTGATANAVARSLRKAGAANVYVAAIARGTGLV
jgi:ComF family protein